MRQLWLFTGVLTLALASMAAEPETKWVYEAQSQLYAPPVVWTDPDTDERRIFISDSDARRLRCIDAKGQQIWAYDGGWTKRLTSAAALPNRLARGEQALLVVGNSDGWVNGVDARTGSEVWKARVGKVEWSNVIWADLEGDGSAEVLVGSEETGVTAIDRSGRVLWNYAGSTSKPLAVRGHIAARDIDNDRKTEVFACGKWGPLCLNGDGTLRWESVTGDDFYDSSVLASPDPHSGLWNLYCTSKDAAALQCFDAQTGQRRWLAPMLAPADIYSGTSVVCTFLDGDDVLEVVLADRLGRVYCFGSDGGGLNWVHPTEKQVPATVAIADADGDGRLEVLASSGDHHLYCISFDGALEWRYAADRRLVGPVSTADVDRDGTLDLLLCGSDHKLRCLTLGAKLSDLAAPPRDTDVTETRPLFSLGGFEQTLLTGKPEDYPQGTPIAGWLEARPRGWRLIQGPASVDDANAAWGRDTSERRTGEACLRVGPTDQSRFPSLRVGTDDFELPPGLQYIDAAVRSKGGQAGARLEWTGLRGLWGITPLDEEQTTPDGWTEHRDSRATPPHWARWVRLVLESQPQTQVRWDDAEMSGVFRQPRQAVVLTNQVGYDTGRPKSFVVRSNFVPEASEFDVSGDEVLATVRCTLTTLDGQWVHNASLTNMGRITGAYGNDWGAYFWRGDFSEVNEPGQYRIEVHLGYTKVMSRIVEIGPDLLWNKTARPAYRFFYYQRCGMEIPGLHGACHLDDSTDPAHTQQYDLAGGWHDAGDYNKYHNAPYVLGLGWAYERRKDLFDLQDEDANRSADLLDELIWGGDHARRMIAPDGSAYGPITNGYGFWGPAELETDGKPLTGDERPTSGPGSDPSDHAAAVAKVAKFTKDPAFVEAAARALQYSLDRNQRGPRQFSAAIDLYLATNDEKYAQLAKDMAPSIGGGEVEALELYDRTFGEDHGAKIREALVAEAEGLLANAKNPFGIWTNGPPEKPNFFGTPAQGEGWHVGNSERMFRAATRMALAYKYNPDPRYLVYIYDQFNWTLGCNPFDVSLMEGVGQAFLPSYHQRLTFAGIDRGAIPGSVVNGVTFRAPGDDSPFVDMSGLDIPAFEPNECWLPHNTAYLNALANLPMGK